MKFFAVVCLSLVLYVDSVRCMTINEFFKSIPGWDSITSAWEYVKGAIERPIKTMRMGRGGKRKTTPSSMKNTSTTTTTTSTLIYETIRDTNYDSLRVILPITVKEIMTTAKAVPIKGKLKTPTDKAIMHPKPPVIKMTQMDAEYTFAPVKAKVKLPYFARPVWKSEEEWKDMQKPYYAITLKGDENNYESEIDNTIYQNDELTFTDPNDSNDALGTLMFV